MQNGFAGMIPRRTMAAGVEIPWPEMLTLLGVVLHKDYRMNAFPRTEDGTPRFNISDDEYLSWLADYLPENIPELTPEQQILAQSPDRENFLSALHIGDTAAWCEHEMADYPLFRFPDDFEKTADFSAVRGVPGAFTYEDYLECIQECPEPDQPVMSRNEHMLYSYSCQDLIEKEEREFARLWPQFAKFNSANLIFMTNTPAHEPPDAGWRIYLALKLVQIPDKSARIKELEEFYRYWHEEICK